ncbi:hypothetical protein Scep_024501 [Stephania cephalantha]|uniref:Uncharacterized protein n=1 Tax=Stephania cephalantha TaxID=152367 RepID=A0AAP0HYB8_9MAGN
MRCGGLAMAGAGQWRGSGAINHYGEASSLQTSNDRRDTDHGDDGRPSFLAPEGRWIAGERKGKGSEGGWQRFLGFWMWRRKVEKEAEREEATVEIWPRDTWGCRLEVEKERGVDGAMQGSSDETQTQSMEAMEQCREQRV